METVLVLVIILAVLIWYGFFAVVEQGLETVNRRAKINLNKYEADCSAQDAEDYIEISKRLDADKVAKAKEAKAELDALVRALNE